MAAQFVGLYMRVVLRDPPGFTLTGTVQNVEAGSSLTLTNVYIPTTQEHLMQTRINAVNIADLSELKSEEAPTIQPAPVPEPVSAVSEATPVRQAAFVDPAILSLGRRPAPRTPISPETHAIPQKPFSQLIENMAIPVMEKELVSEVDSADVQLPLAINTTQISEAPAPSPLAEIKTPTAQAKKRRSRQPRQPKIAVIEDEDAVAEQSPTIKAPGDRGKGWRQTPMLQQASATASFQPFNSLKKNGRGRKGMVENGWASEDVTEEMGEFDFENNLAKFDKRTIFDQMRKEDLIDEADRLVTHNRRIKPGTAGGKNLHYTENVLDLPPSAAANADYWNSEADVGNEGSERANGRDSSSRQSVRRADSKTGLPRRSQSRKASAVIAQPLTRVNSGLGHSHSSQRSTPKPDQPRSSIKRQQQSHQQSQQARQPGLYLVPSNRRLEAISMLQMLNIENIAANEIGFTEDLMAENAGRGIAEVAVKALAEPAMKARFELGNGGAPNGASVETSTIVVLAGNNKSSIRALAAARHLRNKNINVAVCMVGVERERDLLEDLRRQIQLYRNFGGKVTNKNDFFEHVRKSSASDKRFSISLIIDALLGLTISFEELRVGDQATVYELMEWANRNEAFVLSVDVPTGIDPSTGKIAIIDGGHLFIKPRYVVAMGAPKRGLLEAVTPPREGEPGTADSLLHEDEWHLYIADLGLGGAVWRKAGTKVRRGIDFDGKWVLEMRYWGGESEEQDI